MERGAGIARRRDVTNRNSGTRQEMPLHSGMLILKIK